MISRHYKRTTSSSTLQVFHFVSALRATFLECYGTPAGLARAFEEKALP